MKIEIYTYLNQKILYVPEVNYYFNISAVTQLNSGSYEMDADDLLYYVEKYCPEESKVFCASTYEKRLSKTIFNEIKEKKEIQKSQYTLCLHPSRSCNLNCRYCFGQKDYLEKECLSEQTAKDAIDFLVDTYATSAGKYIVDLSGSGEPLLNFELVKSIVEYCDKKRGKTGKNIEVMFATNGTCLTKDIVDYIDNQSVVIIGVSIDGNEAGNNQNRIDKNGMGTYQKILKGIRLFKNKKAGLAVTITPVNQNVDEIYDHLYHLDNIDCVSMKFLRMFDRSTYDFDNFDVPYLISRYEKLCNRIFSEIEQGNFDYLQKLIQGADYFGGLITQNLFKGLNKFYKCDAGKNRIAVNSKGDIYACSVMMGSPDFKIGNIYQNIDSVKQNAFWIPVSKASQKCKNCLIKKGCGGECYANSYLKHGNLHTPLDKMCQITIELTKLSMAFVERIRTSYPETYIKLIDAAFRIQGYSKTDSAVWAIMTYLKYKGINLPYSQLLNHLQFTDKGVHPADVLKFLKNYVEEAEAYLIESAENINEVSYPAVSLINKEKNISFHYLVILERKDNCFLFQAPELDRNSVYEVSVNQYISELSNILIF